MSPCLPLAIHASRDSSPRPVVAGATPTSLKPSERIESLTNRVDSTRRRETSVCVIGTLEDSPLSEAFVRVGGDVADLGAADSAHDPVAPIPKETMTTDGETARGRKLVRP